MCKPQLLFWEVLEALPLISTSREVCTEDRGDTHSLHITHSSRHMQDCSEQTTCACTCLLCQPSAEGSEKAQTNCGDTEICFGSCFVSCFTWAYSDFFPLSAARALISNNRERQSSRPAPVGSHTMGSVFNYDKLKTRGMCLD